MLDWYSGFIGYDGSELKLNSVCETTPDGELVWRTERKRQVDGSYSAAVQVGRAAATEGMLKASERHGLICSPACLYVSGNPSKYLQGHNVIGPSVADLGPVLRSLVRAFPEGIRPLNVDLEGWPALHRTRVDITVTIDLGTHDNVHAWLRSAAKSTRSRHGRAMASGDTVYWGQHSRRWTLKGYCKFCELQKHRPALPGWADSLLPWCEGKLRLELCLRTEELKGRGTLNESILWEYFDRVQGGIMPEQVAKRLEQAVPPGLSRGVQLTLREWQAGVEVRFTLPRRTFYDHRRRILEACGLDISLPYEVDEVEREVFDLGYLKRHQCAEAPAELQGYLFNVEHGPTWGPR